MEHSIERLALSAASAARWIAGGLSAAVIFDISQGAAPSTVVGVFTAIMFVLTIAVEYFFFGVSRPDVLTDD